MQTYTSDHIQECARFIEKNCFNPTILYSEHQYSDSEIYKTILGRYCIELNTASTSTSSQRQNEKYLIDPTVYIHNWLDRYSPVDKHNVEYLNGYLKNNEFNYNLDFRRIITHSDYASATIDVNLLALEKIVMYDGCRRGFNTKPLEVYTEQNGTWLKNPSIIHILKVCAELMDQTLIDAISTIKLKTLNSGMSVMYDDTPVAISAFPDLYPISDQVKLNVFILYSQLNNLEFDISKKHLIELAIDMHMTFEQTLEMYAQSSNKITPCDYPELI